MGDCDASFRFAPCSPSGVMVPAKAMALPGAVAGAARPEARVAEGAVRAGRREHLRRRQYCDYQSNHCGTGATTLSVCRDRPLGCDAGSLPVCGCDGAVYPSECAAAAAGTDLNADGSCTPAAGMFACGELFCASKAQYCRVSLTDAMGYADLYKCQDLPPACGSARSCDCVPKCGAFQCELDAAGNPTVRCHDGF